MEHHRAIVSRNSDPKKLGRIRVICNALASDGVELPFWVEPVFHGTNAGSFGWFDVPEVGSEVDIEVETEAASDERPGETFLTAPAIRYMAAPYSTSNPPPAEFKTNYPKRRGVKTPGGHLFMFDDKAGTVTISAQDGKISLTLDGGPGVALIGTDAASATSPAVLGDVLVNALVSILAGTDAEGVLSTPAGAFISPVGPCFLSPAAAAAIVAVVAKYLTTPATNILSTKMKLER